MDKLLIKPTAGARPAPPHARTNHSQGTHQAASHMTSHERHDDNQAGKTPDRPAHQVSQSHEGVTATVTELYVLEAEPVKHCSP